MKDQCALKAFEFELIYFKPSGKYYSDVKVKWEICCCDNGSAFMADVCAKVLGLSASGSQLPGLIGGWDGPIFVNCEEGYPCLLLPKEEK